MANMEGYGSDPTLPAIANITATMDGIFGLVENPDALYTPGPDYKVRGMQREFLEAALGQARRINYVPRMVRGPHHSTFNQLVEGVQEALHNIDPAFTPDYLMPPGYQTDEVAHYLETHPGKKHRLQKLREDRVKQLCELGRGLFPEAREHELPAGLLDMPRYHKQGEFIKDDDKARLLCTNACFRMVYHDLAGWAPDEDILAGYMLREYGSIVVSDNEYFKLFQTDAFKGVSDRAIKVVEILGADFQIIHKLTSGIKAKHPDAKVYAVVSMGSETARDKDSWHASILLQADRDDVVCQDPSLWTGQRKKLMYTYNFLQRWAIAYNRVQMVIAI